MRASRTTSTGGRGRSRVPRRSAGFLVLAALALAVAASLGGAARADSFDLFADCGSGVRTLSKFGDRVYPDQGNGGYTSIHTDLHMSYDTAANLLLPGTHADLTIQATQCLTDFSFDFERTAMSGSSAGPNMAVGSVLVNGAPATFNFRQPTYPGNPNGPDDPNPAAHAISNVNPVSATNSLPPACSPQVSGNSQNNLQCPANKLVITPSVPILEGDTITVTINYTGRPGLHTDGDGSTEGWFRVNTAAAPNDGGFVTTEPVGNMAWMPLNNHPTAKPTYDVYDTAPVGKTAIGPGELVGSTPGPTLGPLSPTSVNPPDANFPGGSWTWHWHSPEPIASYLIGNSIGSYDLLARTAAGGIQYFQAQASGITAARKAINKIAMDSQEDLTNFQTMFNGPFPFTTDGVIVGIPSASFEEEMQTKITFAGGQIGGGSGTSLGTFAHENMHQWFGDNVSEGGFNLTFWKEGWATVGEYLLTGRTAANAAGGLGTPAGNAAFDSSLSGRFNTNYGSASASAWTAAPSNPTVGSLFTTVSTYTRPGTAYLALRQILDASASRPGSDRWIGAMKQIQSDFGGGSITEAELEDVFHQWLPNQSAACHAKLDQFFTQWFDTAYPTPNNATNKPQITGPGINGPDHFYDDASACTRADQTITFGALPNKAPGDPDFGVSATSDSGLPVTFSASGSCTVAGSTVHITGLGTCTITASQGGDGVFKPAASVAQTFTIHAPVVTNDAAAGGAQVQYSDPLDPTVTISASDLATPGSGLTAVATGLPAGLSLAVGSTSDDATLPGTRTWTVNGATTAAPGTYPVTVTVANDVGTTGSTSFSIVVTKEDAETTYTGDMLAFTTGSGSTAPVLLRATVRDSSVSPAFPGDSSPGDILKATIAFKEGGTTICSPALQPLNGSPTAATASCLTTLALGAHVIDVLVNGYYTGSDEVIVEIAEPDGSYATGGGYTRVGVSGGTRSADAGSKVSFGFNLKYNKNLTNLKGHVNVVFRSGGSVYQVKSTSFESLGIALRSPAGGACSGPPSPTCVAIADFRSKANLSPVSGGGGMTLRITLSDRGEPGSADSIGISLWDGNQLVFSSDWNGATTLEDPLGGGNVVIH